VKYNDSHLSGPDSATTQRRLVVARADSNNVPTEPVLAIQVGTEPTHMGMPVWLDRAAVKELVAEGQAFLDDTEPKLPTEPFSVIDVHFKGDPTDTPDGWRRLVLLKPAVASKAMWYMDNAHPVPGDWEWDDWKLVES
jgi:hypothetical protein